MKQALYRKYRPTNFDEVRGQENIVNILKNQIKNKKISHAYTFSGTRGTGKTSTAKIFAKAVNCLNPIDGNPCNKCKNCKLINEGKSIDIIEMDAASNRRIDDIRQLRDQVIYPPTSLKYKVYIIDEAHMIVSEGFNALLKTIEEPPEYLIFIFATTVIDKIPDTILSRTQRFEFKSLSIEDINKQIKNILEKENMNIEEEAISVISNMASGGMRDALSILDQVISLDSKETIRASEVYDLLGLFSKELKLDFCKNIFDSDKINLLKLIDNEIKKGKNANNFMKEMISFFKELIDSKIGIGSTNFGLDLSNITLDRLINSLDILLEYEEVMKKSDNSDLIFKISATRLIDFIPRKQLESKLKNLEERLLNLEKGNFVILNSQKEDKIEYKKENLVIEKEENEEIKLDSKNTEVEDYLMKSLNSYMQGEFIINSIKSIEVLNKNIYVYVDSSLYKIKNSMDFLFKEINEKINDKFNDQYIIELKENSSKFDSLNEEKLNKLKNLFGDNLNIKDKK